MYFKSDNSETYDTFIIWEVDSPGALTAIKRQRFAWEPGVSKVGWAFMFYDSSTWKLYNLQQTYQDHTNRKNFIYSLAPTTFDITVDGYWEESLVHVSFNWIFSLMYFD